MATGLANLEAPPSGWIPPGLLVTAIENSAVGALGVRGREPAAKAQEAGPASIFQLQDARTMLLGVWIQAWNVLLADLLASFDLQGKFEAAPRRPSANLTLDRGERAVRDLPAGFRSAHKGEHIAMAVDGRVLAIAGTLTELNARLKVAPPESDYVIVQLGRRSVVSVQ